MHSLRILFCLALFWFSVGCSSIQSPPDLALSIPPQFCEGVARRSFRAGDPLTDGLPYRNFIKAKNGMTRITGRYPNRDTCWFIELERGAAPSVVSALSSAKDGYEAKLGWRITMSPILYLRFTHKQFSWGDAVSFLVQYQCDGEYEVPNNDRLTYEIHGITSDHRYTVRAGFNISHPRLSSDGGNPIKSKVRTYRGDPDKTNSPIRQDRDYLLVEKCTDTAFYPSIKEIDALVNTLKPGFIK